ncbi:MAG: hypothetical protein AAF907_12965, partial [Planctomycetota bacterium]
GRPIACPHPAVSGDLPIARDDPPWWRDLLSVRLIARMWADGERCPISGQRKPPPMPSLEADPRATMAAEQALTPFVELAAVAAGWNVRAAVIVLPDGPPLPSEGFSPAVRLILDAASAAGLRTFDAIPALTDAAAGTADGSHGPSMTPRGALTRAGHARLAVALEQFLLSTPGGG